MRRFPPAPHRNTAQLLRQCRVPAIAGVVTTHRSQQRVAAHGRVPHFDESHSLCSGQIIPFVKEGSMSLAQKLLRRIPQYTRNARHLRSVLGHGTARKWKNLLLAESERKLRRLELKSYPYLLLADPCNYCNL